jgi:hypothetical protein
MTIASIKRQTPSCNRTAEMILLLLLLIAGSDFSAIISANKDSVWLAWVGISPLIMAIRRLSPGMSAASGLLWGLVFYLFASFQPGNPAMAPNFEAVLYMAVPAVFAWLMGLFTHRFGFSPLAIALSWIGLELVSKASGLQNSLFSGDYNCGPYFNVLADFLGYGFVAFVIAYINAALLSIPWRIHIHSKAAIWTIPDSKTLSYSIPIFTLFDSYIYLPLSGPRAPPVTAFLI